MLENIRSLVDTKNIDPQESKLRIISIGGTEAVNKNMTVYECGDDIVVVDCGIGFPDSEMHGVDVVIPDFTYLKENVHKIRGLFITHGHEDHVGAVPYFLREFQGHRIPIYGGKLVHGFIRKKIEERVFKKAGEGVSLVLMTPETPAVSLGKFRISAYGVNHSVPESMGFAIRTPQGLVLHTSDFRIDPTPVLDKPMDLERIAAFGKEGVLCLLSDCLNVTTEGPSKSESSLNSIFQELLKGAEGRQFLVTTISSNISRMYQIITAAKEHGRKVVLSGRSISQNTDVARGLGMLPFSDETFVAEEDAHKHNQSDLVYIIAGCYGQQGSGLDRVSRGEHHRITLEKDALVVFSADPNPPGVEEMVNKVMDNLTLAGAEVLYSKIQDNLHVSGHGTKEDLKTLAETVRPKYFIPIGGTITRMRAYTKMVEKLGVKADRVFEMLEGDSVVFNAGQATKGKKTKLQPVFIDAGDGRGVDSVGPVVLKDRERLADDGVFVAVIPYSKKTKKIIGKVGIISRGFVYVKESRSLMDGAASKINEVLKTHKARESDWGFIKGKLEYEVERFLFKKTRRKPVIIIYSILV